MKQITFTIHGNQENKSGNPIPYFRTTQGSQWSKGAKRYHAWQDYVRATYFDVAMPTGKVSKRDLEDIHDFTDKKPIKASAEKIDMEIFIWWANNSHGDCDNIFKGIADALFMNDKYLSGKFDYAMAKDKKGRVDVTITIG